MVVTMAWPGSGLWPLRPALLPDETFSSWFARLAAGNGLSPAELYRVAKAGAHPRPRDLDRYVEPDLQTALTERTGIPEEALRDATFARWAGQVFEEDDGRNKLYWLPLAGSEDSKRSFGQQFCPACLREDHVPYLRLTWRLGFVTACPRHRTLLADRCPDCGEPVQILRTMPVKAIRCWKCQFDLSRAPLGVPTDDGDLERQSRLQEIATAGWVSFGTYGPVYSFVYFRILMLVFRLLATGRLSDSLRTWAANRAGKASPNVLRLKQVELFNTRSRHELIGLASHLMEDWPHRFVEACRATGITNRRLIKGERRYPFAYADPIGWRLSETARAIPAEEVQAGIAYLRKRDCRPTFETLTNLFGVKLSAHKSLAEPATIHTRYGHGRYWKLDGVSSDVRLAVRELAQRSGESLSAWVENALRKAIKGTACVTTVT